MERQYPPFGHIPGSLPDAAYDFYWQAANTALSMTSFQVLPGGLLASLRVTTKDTSLVGATYAFEALSSDEPVQLVISLQSDAESAQRQLVAANLVTGSRGQDEGTDSAIYSLWFSVELADAQQLTLYLSWPEAGIDKKSIAFATEDIEAGLAHAVSWQA